MYQLQGVSFEGGNVGFLLKSRESVYGLARLGRACYGDLP